MFYIILQGFIPSLLGSREVCPVLRPIESFRLVKLAIVHGYTWVPRITRIPNCIWNIICSSYVAILVASSDMPQTAQKPEQRRSETSSTYAEGIAATTVTHVTFDDLQRTRHPYRWSRIRERIREPAAEFLGTMILVIFGCGGDCQVVLSSSPAVASSAKGEYLSLNFGWAIGVAMGVWASGGISGGHLNPAVTLALASVRDFPWRKVPAYIFAQLLGAICGAGIVYANYFHAIDLYEGGPGIRTISGTGDLFATYAADYMSSISCFFSEFLGSAVLIIAILSVTDKRNGPPPPGLVPLALFLVILGIGLALGMETGYAVNPARDLGPRILTAMVGYGKAVFDFRNQYWIWCPVLGPIFGMQIGALVYDFLIFTGSESIVNKSGAGCEKLHLQADLQQQRNEMPTGIDVV